MVALNDTILFLLEIFITRNLSETIFVEKMGIFLSRGEAPYGFSNLSAQIDKHTYIEHFISLILTICNEKRSYN